jgi:hypothetical protein
VSWINLKEDVEEMFSRLEGCLDYDDRESLSPVWTPEQAAEWQSRNREQPGVRTREYKKDYETRTKPRRLAERLAKTGTGQ